MNEQRPPTVLQDILPFEPLPKKSNHVPVHLRIRGLATPHLAIVIVIVIVIIIIIIIIVISCVDNGPFQNELAYCSFSCSMASVISSPDEFH